MPIVPNATTAAEIGQGHGLNDLLRRLFFPSLPPTACVSGYLFFPWGTGPTFPIPCDRDFVLRTVPGGVGAQFVRQPGTSFSASVAELAGVGLDEAEDAVARIAGVERGALRSLTVREVGRRIVDNVLPRTGVTYALAESSAGTFGELVQNVSRLNAGVDDASTLRDIARQTRLEVDTLAGLPLGELGRHLDAARLDPTALAARSSGSTLCAQTPDGSACTVVDGWLEGALWGGFIGAFVGELVGGPVGAAIVGAVGALVGAIIGDIFG